MTELNLFFTDLFLIFKSRLKKFVWPVLDQKSTQSRQVLQRRYFLVLTIFWKLTNMCFTLSFFRTTGCSTPVKKSICIMRVRTMCYSFGIVHHFGFYVMRYCMNDEENLFRHSLVSSCLSFRKGITTTRPRLILGSFLCINWYA